MQSFFQLHTEPTATQTMLHTMPADMAPRKRSKSPSNSSLSQAKPEEDWTKITDLAERRRIQNRIAQRNYRKKLKRRLLELENRASSPETDSPPQSRASPGESAYIFSRQPSQQDHGNKRRSMSHLPPKSQFANHPIYQQQQQQPRKQERRHTMLSPPSAGFYGIPDGMPQGYPMKPYPSCPPAILPLSYGTEEIMEPNQMAYDPYLQQAMATSYDPSGNFSEGLRISPEIVDLNGEQDLLWAGEPSWQNQPWDLPEEQNNLQYVQDWNMRMAASPASEMTRSASSYTGHKNEGDASGSEEDREFEEGLYGIKNDLLDEDVLQWADFWKEQQLHDELPQNQGLTP